MAARKRRKQLKQCICGTLECRKLGESSGLSVIRVPALPLFKPPLGDAGAVVSCSTCDTELRGAFAYRRASGVLGAYLCKSCKRESGENEPFEFNHHIVVAEELLD
jgi:hypothetical protein